MIASALLCAPPVWGQATPAPVARADLVNAKGDRVGAATFTQVGDGVRVEVTVENLSPGAHALHIHTTGRCVGPDFMSAGAHFNPTEKQHGKDNPMGHHLGDLPNLSVDAQGRGQLTVTATGITLGDGANSLFHPGGTALGIHERADDYKTHPTGNAGARLACGVIRK